MNAVWKKAMISIVSTILIAMLFTGCAKQQDQAAVTETPVGTSGSASAATTQPPVVIDWLGYNSYGQPDPNSKVIKMVEDKFNAKFNFWFIDSGNWDDSLNVKLAAGQIPDVLRITSAQQIPSYVEQGILAPLKMDTLIEYAPTYVKFLNDNYPHAWDSVKYKGQIYAIPTTNVNGSYPMMVVWNQRWLTNVGISKTPESLQEFEDALYKFRNNDPDQNGKKDTYGLSDYAIPTIMGAFGPPGLLSYKNADKQAPQVALKDGKLVFAAIQPEMKDALTVLQKWYKDGIIDPEFVTSENTGGYWADSQAFFNGKIGLTGNGVFYHWRNEMDPNDPTDMGGNVYQDFLKVQPDGKVVIGKPAIGPKGASGTTQWSTTSTPMGITTKAINDPRKLETVLRMIEADMTDYDYYNTVLNGIKDEDWTLSKSGNVTPKDTDAASLNQRGINVLDVGVNPDDFLKRQSPFQYQWADAHKTKGYEPPFVPNTDAMAKNSATLSKMTVEAYVQIVTGEKSIDYFDEFVQSFKANGGDETEKAINDALK